MLVLGRLILSYSDLFYIDVEISVFHSLEHYVSSTWSFSALVERGYGHRLRTSVVYHIAFTIQMCSLWLHSICGKWEGWDPVNLFNHTIGVVVVTSANHPESVRNRCVIEDFDSVFCVFTFAFFIFCGYKGFCHRTESDIFFFLKVIPDLKPYFTNISVHFRTFCFTNIKRLHHIYYFALCVII